jgi:opacity protein-like surface antigen
VIRPLAAALVLSAVLSFDTPTVSAHTSDGYPASVLRFRGGAAFPDPPGDANTGWCAGGSIGMVVNRDILVSLGYDRIAMDRRDFGSGQTSMNPVTVELELGMPTRHHFTPRLTVGMGPYFHTDTYFIYRFDGQQRVQTLNDSFGMHFGVGLSVPLWKRTMMDVDYRYHQTTGGADALVAGTATVGLRFLFPGREADSEGYVLSRGAVHAFN